MPIPDELGAAYDFCQQLARSHYENFTVGSWLVPKPTRRHIAAIYAFARTADDLADEGSDTAAERLAKLDDWERQLDAALAGRPQGPIFVALADTAMRFGIPAAPFRSLLQAFRRDAQFQPFATYAELLGYCRCSATTTASVRSLRIGSAPGCS